MGTWHKAQGTGWDWKGKMRAFCVLFFLVPCALCPVTSFAEDISFSASVDPMTIPLGTTAELALTVHGAQDVDKVDLPAIDGFEARYLGPSTQVRVVNGEYSTAKTFIYTLIPLKEGKFTVPSVEVVVKGASYRSDPLVVDVVASSSGGDPLSDPHAFSDKIHMITAVPRTDCFLNEELPLVIKLYIRDLPMKDVSFPDIRQEGFVLSDYGRPRQYEESVDGKRFDVIEFSTRLTPLKAGTITVGPAVLTANIVMAQKTKRDPFRAGAFDDDFFAGFFGSYQKRPVTISARAIDLSVKDLPSEGIPQDFSGAVGRFTFDVTLTPASVKVGDPLTLRMTVAGIGNLTSVKMPTLKDARFKMYDPLIKDEDGKKILEQVLIPTQETIKEVPAVTFSYFDTETGTYQTIVQGPFPVEVLPPQKGEEFQAVGFSDKPVSLLQESFGKDIVFIKDQPGPLSMKGVGFSGDAILVALGVAYLNIWGIFLGLFLYRRRILSDPGAMRRSKAYKDVRLALKEAGHLSAVGDSKAFYDKLTASLKEYLCTKLDISPGEADAEALDRALAKWSVEEKDLYKLRQVLDIAERVRFAGISVTEADMRRDHLDAEDIVEAVERRVRA